MAIYAGPVQDLIDELGRLPGIGPKSAQRIAFHLLKLSRGDATRLADSIREVKDKVTFCSLCFNIAEGSGEGDALCGICGDDRRDATCCASWKNLATSSPSRRRVNTAAG